MGAGTDFMKMICRAEIKCHVSASYSPNENPAEAAIHKVKKKWYILQVKRNVPDRVWDLSVSYVCEMDNVTVSSSRYAFGRTPLEIISGETPDITKYLDWIR